MALENIYVPQICSCTLRIAPRALQFLNFLGGDPKPPIYGAAATAPPPLRTFTETPAASRWHPLFHLNIYWPPSHILYPPLQWACFFPRLLSCYFHMILFDIYKYKNVKHSSPYMAKDISCHKAYSEPHVKVIVKHFTTNRNTFVLWPLMFKYIISLCYAYSIHDMFQAYNWYVPSI